MDAKNLGLQELKLIFIFSISLYGFCCAYAGNYRVFPSMEPVACSGETRTSEAICCQRREPQADGDYFAHNPGTKWGDDPDQGAAHNPANAGPRIQPATRFRKKLRFFFLLCVCVHVCVSSGCNLFGLARFPSTYPIRSIHLIHPTITN